MAINLIDKIKPANNGKFPMVEAEDVELSDGTRLSGQPIIKTVTELPEDAADHPNMLYLVVEESNSEKPPTDGGDVP